ncbi:hypothetical protein BC833DRAFT_605701 [Globomyces pollinis-pini]|nr:hypothetical protein BC833DRAFT_605701 [Globomyces pollinis-pini]
MIWYHILFILYYSNLLDTFIVFPLDIRSNSHIQFRIIQIEILNDTISYHPITSVSTTIVPDLQLFVEASMDQAIGAVDSKSIPGKVIQTDLLQKCQYHNVIGNDSDFKLDDSIIHCILSRPYHYINNEHFWYGICQNFPDGYKVEPYSKIIEWISLQWLLTG